MSHAQEKLTYKADYAKSGRSTCQTCKELISEGTLRMARRVPSHFRKGDLQDEYHHVDCMFKAHTGFDCRSSAEIEDFETLKPKDQERLEKRLKEVREKDKASSKHAANPDEGRPADCPPLKMENAKSSRSQCRKCHKHIQEGELRLAFEAQPDELPESSTYAGPVPWWHHSNCFFDALPQIEKDFNVPMDRIKISWFQGTESIDNGTLRGLEHALDQARKKHGKSSTGGKGSSGGKGQKASSGTQKDGGAQTSGVAGGTGDQRSQAKRGKAAQHGRTPLESTEKKAKKEGQPTGSKASGHEKQLKEQSEKLWDIKKQLKKASLPELRHLLENNGMNTRGSHETVLERAAEGVLFGALEPCKKCGAQNWHAHKDAYHCHGEAEGNAMCDVITRKVHAKPFKVEQDIGDLKLETHKPQKRVWPQEMNDTDSYDQADLKKGGAAGAKSKPTRRGSSEDVQRSKEQRKQTEAKREKRGKGQEDEELSAKRSKEGGQARDKNKPLAGIRIATAGRLSLPIPKLKEQVRELGGEVDSGDLSDKVSFVVVSSPQEVEKKRKTKKVQEALEMNIPIVDEEFLKACEKEHRLVDMKSYVLAGDARKAKSAMAG